MGPFPKSQVPLNPKPGGGQKAPFEFAASRLEVDENVNRTHFMIHWLDVK